MKKLTQCCLALAAVFLMAAFFPLPSAYAVQDDSFTPAESVEADVDSPVEGQWLSLGTISAVNPLYQDVFPEPVLPEPTDSGSAAIHPQADTVYTSISGVGKVLRQNMLNRVGSFTVSYRTDYNSDSLSQATIQRCTNDFFEYAMQHTGKGNEGDYLRWSYGSWSCGIECDISGGKITYHFTYTLTYYTTAAQEKTLAAKIDTVLKDLELDKKTDYQKIFAIYDYICHHVVYDDEHLSDGRSYPLQFTAYAAMVNGRAVCQGYSTLFYRMALESGIDNRILSSLNINHGWNLVELDGNYYQVDSTWDAKLVKEGYQYFLCNLSQFKHLYNNKDVVADEYSDSAFAKKYPICSTSYNGRALSGTTANGMRWAYQPEERTLTLTGSGKMENYTASNVPWLECLPLVRTLVLSEGITSIGDYAFISAPLLRELTLPDSVTAIGSYAFYGDDRLSGMTISPTVRQIGNYALGFYPKGGKPTRIAGFILRGDLYTEVDRYTLAHRVFFDSSEKLELNIDNCDITLTTPTLFYNATKQKPKLSILVGDTALQETLDYTLSCTNNLNIGVAYATITFVGRYSGEEMVCYEIQPQSLSKAKVTLKTTSFVYNGKAQKPAVTVTLNGRTVSAQNYTVTYTGNTNIGTAKVTLKGKNNLSGSSSLTFSILPKAPTLSSVKKASAGKLTVKWKKLAGVTGYRVQYSTNNKFTNANTKSVKKAATVSMKLTGLSKKKKYYVRVQSFKTVSGQNYYSAWSKVKNAKC